MTDPFYTFSPLPDVNEAVIGLIACLRFNPYAPLERIEQGTMTLGEIIGDPAACRNRPGRAV